MANAINKFPVPLAFKKILKDNLSGELIISRADLRKDLFFIDGRLVFATTNLKHERLGEILLAAGKIDISQLRTALEIRENIPTKIGEILAKVANLNMRNVYEAIVTQVKGIAVATFPLNEGEWRFVIKNPTIPNPQSLNVRMPELLREGVKSMQDMSYFKRKFYYRSPVITELPESITRALTAEEIEFHQELGRFFNTSVKQIMSWWNIPEPVFWRNIILLYILNVADFVEFTLDDEEQNQKIEEINDMYQRINSGQLDYYQLLATQEINTVEEINKHFDDYSQKYDPEKLNVAPDSTTMLRARDVYAEIQKAYNTRRQEIEHQIAAVGAKGAETAETEAQQRDQEQGQPEVSQANQVKQARELFSKANFLHNQKKYFEAASLLEEAVAKDNSRANYFLLLGLCQAKMPATKKLAEKNLQKAAEMEPWNADPVFALGQLYRSENLMKKAKEYFEKALEINMEHTLAGKAMKDFGGLAGEKKPLFSLFGKKK